MAAVFANVREPTGFHQSRPALRETRRDQRAARLIQPVGALNIPAARARAVQLPQAERAEARAAAIRDMRALRARAIANGMRLKSIDAINEEIREMRNREG